MALQHLIAEWLIFFSGLNILLFDVSKEENLLSFSVYPDVKGRLSQPLYILSHCYEYFSGIIFIVFP